MKYIFLVFFFLTPSSIAGSICDLEQKIQRETLTLFTEHWPPYQVVGERNTLSGITLEKISKALNKADWPFQINIYPWARAVYLSKNVENSFLFSVARFPERENEFQWVAPLATVTSKLIRFNNKKNIKIESLQDIKKYMTILKRGEASSIFFAENGLIEEDKVIWVTDSSQALKLLEIGRGDLYPATVDGFNEAIKQGNYQAEQFKYIYDFKELDVELYLATSLDTSSELVSSVSALFSCKNSMNN